MINAQKSNKIKSYILCHYAMLDNQVMHITLVCLYLFCAAAVLLSCFFRALKISNHHIRLISGSTKSKQSSRWKTGHQRLK